MTAPVGVEDLAAMRAEGDLGAFLRGLVAKASASPVAGTPPRNVPQFPRARPGAWPDGTRPPAAVLEVAATLARYWPDRYPPVQKEEAL